MTRPMPFPAHLWATLTLGLPLVGSQLGQLVIHVTDTLLLGRYGVADLAAQAVASSVLIVLIVFGSGFAFAVMPLVAAAAESGDEVQIRRVTRMGLWASMGFAAVVLPACLAIPDLFVLLGQTPEVAALADRYFAIALWSLIPALVVMLFRSYLSALEHARAVLWATLASALVNGLVAWVLIFGHFGAPELGIVGAAIGAVVSNVFAAVAMALYAVWREPAHQLFVRLWRPDWSALGAVFRLGWPIALTALAEVALFSAASVMMGWVGTDALAAHGIALQLCVATFMVQLGLSQAATVRAGQAYARGDAARLRLAALAAMTLSAVAAALSVLLFVTVPEPLIGLFLSPSDPQRATIIALGSAFLAAAALFQVADSAQVIAQGLLRGVQDTRWPMIFAAASYWGVAAPVAWLLGIHLGWGGVGIWIGLAVGLFLAAVSLMLRFWIRAVPAVASGTAAA
jgi:MATE family multidrug resistance protein